MTKDQFISILSQGLYDFPANERMEIIYDYEEHFRVGKENGKTDEEIIRELGDPYTICSQYKANYEMNGNEYSTRQQYNNQNQYNNQYRKDSYNNTRYNRPYNSDDGFSKAMKIVGIIALVIICLPVITTIGGLILGIFGVSIGLFVGGIGTIIGGLVGTVAVPFISIPLSVPLIGVVLLGIGLSILGVLIFFFGLFVCKAIYVLSIKVLDWFKLQLQI